MLLAIPLSNLIGGPPLVLTLRALFTASALYSMISDNLESKIMAIQAACFLRLCYYRQVTGLSGEITDSMKRQAPEAATKC